MRKNCNLVCLIREENGKENWWGPGVFSPGPPNCNLPNLGRKQKRKKIHLKRPNCPLMHFTTNALSNFLLRLFIPFFFFDEFFIPFFCPFFLRLFFLTLSFFFGSFFLLFIPTPFFVCTVHLFFFSYVFFPILFFHISFGFLFSLSLSLSLSLLMKCTIFLIKYNSLLFFIQGWSQELELGRAALLLVVCCNLGL